jgi:signal transduction histidine kinase
MGADISFALDNFAREVRRREAEKALLQATAERLRALEELREKDHLLVQQSRQAAMGEMIGNIAHQWRQPLNTLGLAIQDLALSCELGELSPELLQTRVDKAMQVISHMSRTIDDFRNFFRPDKQKEPFKVSRVIGNALSLIGSSYKNLQIRVEVDTGSDPIITGYPNEFAQVFLNILNNAKDALVARAPAVPAIKITLHEEAGKTIVLIRDNAGGIPEEILDKIFDPYFSTKEPEQGTGLGLFMAKTIIETNMGGKLFVRNTGDGAEFRIEV